MKHKLKQEESIEFVYINALKTKTQKSKDPNPKKRSKRVKKAGVITTVEIIQSCILELITINAVCVRAHTKLSP